MKNKQVKKVEELKAGHYYKNMFYSPQGSPSNWFPFFIMKIEKKDKIVTIKTSDGREEILPISKIKEFLGYDHVSYSYSDKKEFTNALKETISEKQKERKELLVFINNLKSFIDKLP